MVDDLDEALSERLELEGEKDRGTAKQLVGELIRGLEELKEVAIRISLLVD